MSVKTLAKSPVGGEGGLLVTGTYTGDGAATQAIIGVGFTPRFILIYPHATEAWGSWGFKNDHHGIRATIYDPGGFRFAWYTDEIISLDADGFTVGDGTPSGINHFNRTDVVYTYICFN